MLKQNKTYVKSVKSTEKLSNDFVFYEWEKI